MDDIKRDELKMELADGHDQKPERQIKEGMQELLFGFLANVNSANTAKARKSDLKIFFEFVENHLNGKRIEEVKRTDILFFKNFLLNNERGSGRKVFSRASINRILTTISSFFDHCLDCEVIEKSPVVRIKRFKIEKKIKSAYLKEKSVQAMLKSIDRTNGAGKLHFAILTTLFNTGMRQGELRELRIKNLTYSENTPALKYISKGGEEVVTPMNEKMEEAFGDYLLYRKEESGLLESEAPLFCSFKTGRKLASSTIDFLFKKYAKKAGIKDKVSAQCARVSVISSLKEKGVGIDDIANYVGHKDIKTTETYIKSQRDKSSIANLLGYQA